jgi:hypothetical protein
VLRIGHTHRLVGGAIRLMLERIVDPLGLTKPYRGDVVNGDSA